MLLMVAACDSTAPGGEGPPFFRATLDGASWAPAHVEAVCANFALVVIASPTPSGTEFLRLTIGEMAGPGTYTLGGISSGRFAQIWDTLSTLTAESQAPSSGLFTVAGLDLVDSVVAGQFEVILVSEGAQSTQVSVSGVFRLPFKIVGTGDFPEGTPCHSANPPPPEQKDQGPPVVLANSIVLDSLAATGEFRLVAQDPDGPVHLTCDGAFAGEASDSLVVVRPFAELRFADELLTTRCTVTQGLFTMYVRASIADAFAIDRPPTKQVLPPTVIQVGEPSPWRLQVTDDWGVASYWLDIASYVEPDCVGWSRVGTWLVANQRSVDTTVAVTFVSPGPHCALFGAQDDRAQAGASQLVVEVAP